MRPQDGVAGLEQRFRDLEAKVTAMSAMLGITSTSGTSPNLAGGGGLGAGFNFDGEMIGTLEGHAPPIEVASFVETVSDLQELGGGPAPITWTKVKSDYGITYDDARIQMPSDGLFMIFLTYSEVWARRSNRAGNAGTLGRVIDGGNMVGAVLFASSTFATETITVENAAAELIGGTLLAYGNAVALGLAALYVRTGDTTVILPTRIDVTAEVHRILEG